MILWAIHLLKVAIFGICGDYCTLFPIRADASVNPASFTAGRTRSQRRRHPSGMGVEVWMSRSPLREFMHGSWNAC